MKITKNIMALLLVVAMIVCVFAGCTPSATEEPTKEPETTATTKPEPTATPETTSTPKPSKTPKPSPTPKPDPATLYTWDYIIINDAGDICPSIVLKEGINNRDLTEVVVPAEIDGHKVTVIADDFFGSRSEWEIEYTNEAGQKYNWQCRKGFCQVYEEGTWTDPDCYVTKVTFPDTVEYYIGNIFWFGCSSLREIVFEGTDNVKHIGRCAFDQTPALASLCKATDGYFVVNGELIACMPTDEIVFPADVKRTSNAIFHISTYRELYNIKVKTIRINDGCEYIDKYLTEWIVDDSRKTALKDLYIPASVTYMDPDMFWWTSYNQFNVHVVEGSYADEHLKNYYGVGWDPAKIIYDME